jgi:hypothetical protein
MAGGVVAAVALGRIIDFNLIQPTAMNHIFIFSKDQVGN